MLQARFAYSTNGRRIYQIDMETAAEGYVESYPTPDELWQRVFATPNEWRDRFAAIPYPDKSGSWTLRYYQQNAVDNALESIAAGKARILLTLATGTGKTSIAFQISWKLFQTRWNLSGKPERLPRILFLADRNNLANQAFNDFTAFAAFEDKAMARIKPEEIRRQGRVPKNASVFFTIFQTFMSGTGADGEPAPYFGDYPKDFFDFIIIDECHRGGANDESNWRGILEYFSPAVQLGLTATPKRRDNVDTYAYFGEPVYLVFPGRGKVVFVHGCFWHRHTCATGTRLVRTRSEYWVGKFERNVRRDARKIDALLKLGWKVLVLWECELKDTGGLRKKLVEFLGANQPPMSRK